MNRIKKAVSSDSGLYQRACSTSGNRNRQEIGCAMEKSIAHCCGGKVIVVTLLADEGAGVTSPYVKRKSLF